MITGGGTDMVEAAPNPILGTGRVMHYSVSVFISSTFLCCTPPTKTAPPPTSNTEPPAALQPSPNPQASSDLQAGASVAPSMPPSPPSGCVDAPAGDAGAPADLPAAERRFLQRFTDAFRNDDMGTVQQIVGSSAPVILLDVWSGSRVAGFVYPSLGELLSSPRWRGMLEQHFPAPFEGRSWVVGHRRPQTHCGCPSGYYDSDQANQIVYGRLVQPDYFRMWDGDTIHYDVAPNSPVPDQYSEAATHFVFSRRADLGFVFRYATNRWQLLGIDAMARDC